MTNTFQPMLANDAVLEKLVFPLLAFPKRDGVRGLRFGNAAVTREMKDIPNHHIRNRMLECMEGLDGELVVGSDRAADTMQKSVSGVMKRDGEPDFTWWVFDHFLDPALPFFDRYAELLSWDAAGMLPDFVKIATGHAVETLDQLMALHRGWLELGYEGTILRQAHSPYKFGRSTAREGYLLRIKEFLDAEAWVVGFEELMHNDNEMKRDAFGRAERSSAKAGKRPSGTLGALICEMSWPATGEMVVFNVGTGFTAAQRAEFWALRGALSGQRVKFSYMKQGSKDKPRFPVFLGFRPEGA